MSKNRIEMALHELGLIDGVVRRLRLELVDNGELPSGCEEDRFFEAKNCLMELSLLEQRLEQLREVFDGREEMQSLDSRYEDLRDARALPGEIATWGQLYYEAASGSGPMDAVEAFPDHLNLVEYA